MKPLVLFLIFVYGNGLSTMIHAVSRFFDLILDNLYLL